MESPNIVIRTRLVQFLMISPFILPLYWFLFLLIFSDVHYTIEFKVSSGMISVALFMISRTFLSDSQVATVEHDRIVFASRKPILFDQLVSVSFDDGLTLRARGALFAFIVQNPGNKEGYGHFIKAFRSAFSEWQKNRLDKGMPVPRQNHFYGTWKARMVGCGMLFTYALLVALSLKFQTGYWMMVHTLPVTVMLALFLFFRERTD